MVPEDGAGHDVTFKVVASEPPPPEEPLGVVVVTVQVWTIQSKDPETSFVFVHVAMTVATC